MTIVTGILVEDIVHELMPLARKKIEKRIAKDAQGDTDKLLHENLRSHWTGTILYGVREQANRLVEALGYASMGHADAWNDIGGACVQIYAQVSHEWSDQQHQEIDAAISKGRRYSLEIPAIKNIFTKATKVMATHDLTVPKLPPLSPSRR